MPGAGSARSVSVQRRAISTRGFGLAGNAGVPVEGEKGKAADEIRTHDVQLGKLADVSSKGCNDKGLDGRGVGGVTKKVLSAREISDLVDSCTAIPAHIKASIRSLLESVT